MGGQSIIKMNGNFLNSSKIKTWFPYALLVLIIVLPWFLKSGYLFFTDMAWGPNIIIPDFLSSGLFYLFFLIKILNFILPSELIEKLFISAVFGVILFGGYKIAGTFSKDKIIIFLGSVFALFNPFVYDRLMYGQMGVILGYSFFLVAFGYLVGLCLESFNKRGLFLGSIFAGLSTLLAPHFIFFIELVYSIFGILIFLKLFLEKKTPLLKISKYFLLGILIILTMNLNWLFGAFLGSDSMSRSMEKVITEQDLEAFKTRGENSFEVAENIFLMSGFWGMEQYRYTSLKSAKENWGRSFYFLLPIIVWGLSAGLRDKEKRKLKITLLIIYMTAFILALGTALPITSKITLWLFNNIPFYKGLREPQKWVAAMVAVYEVLLVCGLVELFKKKIVIKNKGLITVLLAFIVVLQTPLMVWGGAQQIRSTNYPQDWYEVDTFIVKEAKCQNKILFLPWHLYMGFKWIGSVVANPSSKFFQCPVIYGRNIEFWGIYNQSLDENDVKIERWLFSFGKTHLLQENKLNIGYIVLAKEVDWRNYLWIENHPNVELVKQTENLILYRVHPVK